MPLPVFNNFYNNLYTLLQYVYKKTLKIEGLPSNECIESKIRLKYSHCENAVTFLVHCSQLIFKACEPIVLKPSGGCEQLTLVGECGVLHQYANNGMKLEPHGDLQLSSCDGVIALERDTEVRCDHQIIFTNDSSFLSTAGTVQRIITGDYTLQLNDNGQSVMSTASGNITVYLPDAAGVPFPMGAKCTIISGSNKIYLTAASNSTTTHLLQSGNSNYYSSWYIPPFTVATVYRTNTVDWIIDANSLTINN
jgi:hypothetical protein